MSPCARESFACESNNVQFLLGEALNQSIPDSSIFKKTNRNAKEALPLPLHRAHSVPQLAIH